MAAVAILVNGMPASGKSTIGGALAEMLGCPFLSKDRIKEPLAEIAGPTIASRAIGGIAMDTVWAMAGAVEAGVVVDAVWLPERDRGFLEAGLTAAGSPRVVEVWCDVDRAVAEERLRERYAPSAPGRHGVHGGLEDLLAFWEQHGSTAGPVGPSASTPWPVVRIDTGKGFDGPDLMVEIAAHFGA